MAAVIDFHSHILPGIDDGSRSLADSIEMLRMEAQQGITHVVATPHFYAHHDRPGDFLARRDRAEAALRREMASHPGLPRLSVGAEVLYFRGISEAEILTRLTISGTNCILIEMEPGPWGENIYRELAQIREKRGLIPIVAHIDRYIRPLRTYGIPRRLEELPVLVQANADFFLRRATAGMAMRMLKADRIHLLGSDCHDPVIRKPALGDALAAIEKHLGPQIPDRICQCGSRLLADDNHDKE